MIQIKRWHLVAATAAPLAVVLIAAALVISRGGSRAPVIPVVEQATESEGPSKLREKSRALKPAAPVETKLLAVSADGFDRINTSLDELGVGYRYEIIDDDVLLDLAKLKRFEAVFLACADVGEPQENLPKVLRDYVTGGGTLYASDLRYDVMALAFPEFKDDASVAQGVPQEVRGEVTSPELRDLLGPEIALKFKSERWRTAAFRGDDVSVLLKGQLKTTAGVPIEAPVAVRFAVGKGAVIFNSFHSEGRVSDVESKLMKFLAVKTVTSPAEVRVTESVADGGFTTRAVAAVAADTKALRPTHAFQLEKPGPLKIQLEPARPGALFRLEIIGPDGKTTTKRGDSTLAIDLADAKAGRWQYRATVEKAPYSSFPAVVLAATSGSAPDSSSEKMNPALVVTGGNVRFEEIALGDKNVVKEPRPLRIAVTKPQFDDMGRLLNQLGEGYRYSELSLDDLLRPATLDSFDVLFLTCGAWQQEWVLIDGLDVGREAIRRGVPKPVIRQRLQTTLDRFVRRGGTLYVSDFRIRFIHWAFPDRLPPVEVSAELVKKADSAEQQWLDIIGPFAEVKTVTGTLNDLNLGEEIMRHAELLAAAFHTSFLARMPVEPRTYDDAAIARGIIARLGLPATPQECAVIGRTFSRRRQMIATAIAKRSSLRTIRVASRKSAGRLDELRNELWKQLEATLSNEGRPQAVDAEVVDAALQEFVGNRISLRFPDNAWSPGLFVGNDVQVLMKGTYRTIKNDQREAPLLVKFKEGKGTIIFTSFHNEAQNSEQELRLLRYLVFSAVTAQEEALTLETMLAGGFSPIRKGQVNHSSGTDSITKKYLSETGDPLRFALTLAGNGAVFRLTLVAPGGKPYEIKVDRSVVIEATGAPAGEWLYSVTAVKVPYANFAYSVSIGKGAAAPAKPSR
jgi:hypothetical protein